MTETQANEKTAAESFRKHGTDTGSAAVQVAQLSEKINYLTEHFKTHAKDYQSRCGLLKLVGKRRRLLDYLRKKDAGTYNKVISDLGIRR